jgi:HSP90 family molecular chaperone
MINMINESTLNISENGSATTAQQIVKEIVELYIKENGPLEMGENNYGEEAQEIDDDSLSDTVSNWTRNPANLARLDQVSFNDERDRDVDPEHTGDDPETCAYWKIKYMLKDAGYEIVG